VGEHLPSAAFGLSGVDVRPVVVALGWPMAIKPGATDAAHHGAGHFAVQLFAPRVAVEDGNDRIRPSSLADGRPAVNVFLPHIIDFEAMNGVYDLWIDKANPPARACTEARLADPDLRIEISAVAAIPRR
jgi:Endoribonuclease L-PSP